MPQIFSILFAPILRGRCSCHCLRHGRRRHSRKGLHSCCRSGRRSDLCHRREGCRHSGCCRSGRLQGCGSRGRSRDRRRSRDRHGLQILLGRRSRCRAVGKRSDQHHHADCRSGAKQRNQPLQIGFSLRLRLRNSRRCGCIHDRPVESIRIGRIRLLGFISAAAAKRSAVRILCAAVFTEHIYSPPRRKLSAGNHFVPKMRSPASPRPGTIYASSFR